MSRLLLAAIALAACHAPTEPQVEVGSIEANGCVLRTETLVYSLMICPAPPYAKTWTGSINGGPVLTFTVTWDF